MWEDEGYQKPQGADEDRVEAIAISYKKAYGTARDQLRDELKRLIKSGTLRIGYKDRARRLRIRIKKL